ncbi:MAG: PAS domain S-box protein [Polaromonas sp.]|uniref:PAS domain S-box protein n=1 Tax=Polaromonas sp. TaxID=1869339 RepID=UPI0024872A7C|nr:PAS domain S-box protein [Polaromonas sp.]MDI1268753.1 PAS domain S-box protein [Polaromonas sp.]
MKLPFRTNITIALGLGLLLMALSTVTSYLTINSLLEDEKSEEKIQATVVLLERLVSQFKTAESLQRRYLLTNIDQDLAAYRQAGAGLQEVLLGASGLPMAGERLEDLRTLQGLIVRRLDLMERAVSARQQAGLEAATVLDGSDLNRRLHDEIEELAGRIKSAQVLTLERSEQNARRTAQTVRMLILLSGLLSLGLLGWTIRAVIRAQANSRRIQAELADSEAMSRAITESMADGVITATSEGLVVNANSAARHLFGYRLKDLLGQPVAMLLPARWKPGFSAFFATLADRPAGFKESDTEVMGVRRDGSEFPVNVSFGDVNVGGRRLFTAIIRDISERKRIADALRDSEAQLHQLTDNVPALMAYVDSEQRFQFHNKAYEEVFGLPREKIHGKTLLEIAGPEFYSRISGHVQEALSGYAVRYEREQVTASGERREYVMSYLPRYSEDGEDGEEDKVIGFFSLGTDVTELKRIDRMKSEFVSTVSHELRTPLTSIRGSLGLVSGGVAGALPERARSLVEIAKNNCERLIRLINDILDSEKIESGKMQFELQPQELLPLLQQTLADNEGFAAQHQVKLALHAPRQPLKALVDSDRLLQVMTNLLSNAIKFSPAQGTVLVLLGRHAGRVRVEVSDNGPGIPEEFRERIFQKFSQADSSDTRQKGGTGLGLAISKAIVERMDGSLGFTSKVDVGTTFFFELPEWREAPPVTAPMSLCGINRPRILVCEDDPDVAQLIGMMLDKAGFDADIAHTAAQARDYLKMESYAAMTVDVHLPYENGLQLIRSLRQDKRTTDLPVLVLSVTAAEARLYAGSTLAVTAWLEKPIDERRLLGSLRQAIDSRRTHGKR